MASSSRLCLVSPGAKTGPCRSYRQRQQLRLPAATDADWPGSVLPLGHLNSAPLIISNLAGLPAKKPPQGSPMRRNCCGLHPEGRLVDDAAALQRPLCQHVDVPLWKGPRRRIPNDGSQSLGECKPFCLTARNSQCPTKAKMAAQIIPSGQALCRDDPTCAWPHFLRSPSAG